MAHKKHPPTGGCFFIFKILFLETALRLRSVLRESPFDFAQNLLG